MPYLLIGSNFSPESSKSTEPIPRKKKLSKFVQNVLIELYHYTNGTFIKPYFSRSFEVDENVPKNLVT